MTKTWLECYQKALNDTLYAHKEQDSTKEQFLGTFTEFYEELIAENLISSWPIDPPGSHSMAKNKAAVYWADSQQ